MKNDKRLFVANCLVAVNVPAPICRLGKKAVKEYILENTDVDIDEVISINRDPGPFCSYGGEEYAEDMKWIEKYKKDNQGDNQ